MVIIGNIESSLLRQAELIRHLEFKPNKTSAEEAALGRMTYCYQLHVARLQAVKSGKRSKNYDVDKFEAAAYMSAQRECVEVSEDVKSLLKDIANKSK